MILLTLTTDEEIKDYLLKIIWERCQQTSWDQRDHKQTCMFLYKSITEALQMVSWSAQTPPMIDAYFYDTYKTIEAPSHSPELCSGEWVRACASAEDKWLGILLSLQEYIVIRGEEYNIREGTAILTWSGEYRYERDTSLAEQISIKDHPQKCVITLIRRSSNLGEIRERRIKITEYEDRYDEEITKGFIVKDILTEARVIRPANTDLSRASCGELSAPKGRHKLIKKPEVIRRTIWKRDLFREEFHTIPFKPIHNELLYSPDLPLWYTNRCNEAKEHFDSLR